MGTHGGFSNTQGPDMQIMDFLHSRNIPKFFFEFMDRYTHWHSFHKHSHAIFDNRNRGENDQNSKDEGANGISQLEILVKENDQGRDDHTNALDGVT